MFLEQHPSAQVPTHSTTPAQGQIMIGPNMNSSLWALRLSWIFHSAPYWETDANLRKPWNWTLFCRDQVNTLRQQFSIVFLTFQLDILGNFLTLIYFS